MNNTLLQKAFELIAEAKNARMMESKDSKFAEKLADIYATIKALAKVTPDKKYISVGDTMYDLAEYNVPKNILSLINVTNIYINSDAAYKTPFMTGDWEAEDEGAKILEPAEFNAFWTRWNSNQYNAKVDCISCIKSVKTLMDVGAILVGDAVAVINDAAEINELVAKTLQLSMPSVTFNNVESSVYITDQEVALWLLSN